ncbi:MAG: PAS domain S-box protein [Candidatus Lokiarchaeota archaeon]|nr:PAS domain S-box protein [Candidatus Lokiarchaeota archaeon]
MTKNSDKKITVLVVDDNPADRDLIGEYLEADGGAYELIFAETLAKAIACTGQTVVDVVLLDLGLPDSQGLETFRQFQAKTEGVPVIVVTGLDDDDTGQQAIAAGAQDYLPKNRIDSYMLTRAIRFAIERYESIARLQESEQELRAANQQLHKNEMRLHLALESASEGIWEWDYTTGLVTFDQTASLILGYEVDFAPQPGQWCIEQIHSEDRPDVEKAYAAYLSQEAANYNVEFRMATSNGTYIWLASTARIVLRDEQGEPLLVVGIHRDITERKQAEEALKRQHAMLARTEALANIGSWEWDIDSDHVRWSDELFRIFRRDPGAGAPSFAGHPELYVPEDMQRLKEAVERCVASGTPYELDLRAIRSDGEIRHCVARGQAQTDKSGRIFGLAGSLQDVTKEKQLLGVIVGQRNRMETLMQAIPAPVFSKDKEGRYLGCNRAFETITGCKRAQIVGKTVHEIWPEKYSSTYRDKDLELLATGREQQYEFSLVDAKGEKRDVVFYKSAFQNQAGNVDGLVGVMLDITERKQTEKALRYSENLFRRVFEVLPVGLWIADKNGTLQEGNPEGVRIWGGNPLVPQKEYGIFKARRLPSGEEIAPDDWALVHTVNEGISVTDERLEIDAFDGVKRVIINHTAPVTDETGNLLAAVVVNQDVTKQYRVEAERERLMMAIGQAAEAVVITDTKGIIVYVNPAFEQVTGYTREEAIGQNPRVLKSGEQVDTFYREMWETLTRGEDWSGRIVNKKKNGEYFTEEAVISPVFNDVNQIVNYVAVKRDITEQLGLEERLRQSQKLEAIGQLAGGVAHDFNNCLGGISGYVELMSMKSEDPATIVAYAAKILSSVRKAANLTKQLLNFARKATIDPQPMDIHGSINQTVEMLRHTIDRRIELQTILLANRTIVNADASQIENALLNLGVNARDAMPEGGQLVFETAIATINKDSFSGYPFQAVPGDYVKITVSDTGTGMDNETKIRIFEPFFTTKEVGKGTGLGLASVYGTMKQHNGYVTLDSGVGHGTSFHLFVPLADKDVCSGIDEAKTGPVAGVGRILFVDDEENIRDSTAELLGGLGYEVACCSNGQEAVEYYSANQQQVDAVILDMVMPKMGGLDCYRRLKTLNPDVKVLVASGYGEQKEQDAIMNEGAKGFMIKPFRMADLSRALAAVLKVKD